MEESVNLDLFEPRPEGPGDEKPDEEAPKDPGADPDSLEALTTEDDRSPVGTSGKEEASSTGISGTKSPVPSGALDSGEIGPEEPRVWSVSEVNQAVRTLLEEAIPPLWIGGEVGNWTRARSGHRYFTLKDESAQLDCVMWRQDADRLPADPEEGMKVRAFGSLTLYEARGRYQLRVRRLEGEGAEGLWRIAFEKLRKRLEEEGLLAPERKRPLPRFPERIGVVTSPTGAALRDILTVIRRRAPWSRVLLRGSRVQGEGAAEEVAAGIRVLGESGLVEVLIVGRGGGSLEDLWAFNEEPVARAVAECPVPVVSAVGHEVDVTISDLVADLRAPTPSAAAEAVVPDGTAIREGVRAVSLRLARGLRASVERRSQALAEALDSLGRAIRERLEARLRSLGEKEERMDRAIRSGVERRRHRLAGLAGKVEALSPLSTLRRGYAVPLSPEGTVLRRAGDFSPGLRFDLRILDGRVECEAVEILEEENFGDG